MDVRPIAGKDYQALDQAGGYAKLFGKNIAKWTRDGYVKECDCYVFAEEENPIGGLCFADDSEEERQILDFALIRMDEEGSALLERAVKLGAKPATRKFSYNLYDDTDQFADILSLFLNAGFVVAQEKMRYVRENPLPLDYPGPLRFRNIAETGEEAFVRMVEMVTRGTLDSLMARDAERLGSRRAAREYVESLKEIDFNPHWWRVGYLDGNPVGLILPQRFSANEGAINYVGTLPEARGRGYGLHLLAEGTRILCENGITKIYADIDVANKPLAASLELLGYAFKMEEAVLTKSL
ncbi:MAG: GNAT family N-acetyltransferase [Treponema sp.]|nr:GNAT family N-acetyltransferase [Treponema sp.]